MHQCSFYICKILIIHIKVSYDTRIFYWFYVKDGSHVRLWHPSCVYIIAQRPYTAGQKTRRIKALNLENFDNSHKSFLWPEYFIDFLWKIDPMSGCDIHLVFTLLPRDRSLQYKKMRTLPWNNFSCIIILTIHPFRQLMNEWIKLVLKIRKNNFQKRNGRSHLKWTVYMDSCWFRLQFLSNW